MLFSKMLYGRLFSGPEISGYIARQLSGYILRLWGGKGEEERSVVTEIEELWERSSKDEFGAI